ncbi:hypothetical protein BX616_000692 [Lobosporangium transversale]|uniref:Metalloprotease C21orf57 n=1 Tax=Lobosporangium transversale TaxID=64571 RepID=A0A1Y2GCH4_9FUNG|nr:metalloprotease C21orf57 [Lobosporangium transversale]KAF9917533.1 hypothetical protein BX616_000692 [Lobosporangium transversale]ORZ04161.1 metalloprotease C21orf57 [Lobosporangium transversale]|eukprot:XP_021876375.1 metalloprotease C21orf57 [Lobosporangium transversale]
MIRLINKQYIFRLDKPSIKKTIQMLITAAGYPNYDIGVMFTVDKTIRKLNREYRGKDKPTDILSFPFVEALKPGKLPKPQSVDERNLGDIVISMRYLDRWCGEHGVDINDRLPVLYAHGICHLLGYDHENKKDYLKMRRKERKILDQMNEWKAIIEEQNDSSSKAKSSRQ